MKKRWHILFICVAAVALIATVPCFVYVASAPPTRPLLSAAVFFWMAYYANMILHSARLLSNAKNSDIIPITDERSRRRGRHLFIIVWSAVTAIAAVGYLLYTINKPLIGPVGNSLPNYDKLIWITVYYCIFAAIITIYSACHLHALNRLPQDEGQTPLIPPEESGGHNR